MNAASRSDPAAGSLLLALRHALADPLSTAALKLELVEMRLGTPAGADPAWVVERVRAAQAEVGGATRLLDLLRHLAEIAAEAPRRTTLSDVCGAAGLPLDGDEDGGGPRPLTLRPRASADAVLHVAAYVRGREGAADPSSRAAVEDGCVTLTLAGARPAPEGSPARLLDLPHGDEDAEALFLARAAAEADGGRLELASREGLLVARFSWPVAGAGAGP